MLFRSPRDIVILTPDVARYAPLVSAVFEQGRRQRQADGWGASGGPRLEVAVADLGLRELNPLADVLVHLLKLVESKLTVTTLFDFAALDVVRRAFGLKETDIDLGRAWLGEAGARWGADADERARAGQPGLGLYTIGFALDRWALGATMVDDGMTQWAGIAPWHERSGDSDEVLGRLMELCNRVQHWRTRLQSPRPMSEIGRAHV